MSIIGERCKTTINVADFARVNLVQGIIGTPDAVVNSQLERTETSDCFEALLLSLVDIEETEEKPELSCEE